MESKSAQKLNMMEQTNIIEHSWNESVREWLNEISGGGNLLGYIKQSEINYGKHIGDKNNDVVI